MDPEKCWQEITEAVEGRRKEDLNSGVAALTEWLDEGGKPPLLPLNEGQATCVPNDEVRGMMVRRLCRRFLQESRDW